MNSFSIRGKHYTGHALLKSMVSLQTFHTYFLGKGLVPFLIIHLFMLHQNLLEANQKSLFLACYFSLDSSFCFFNLRGYSSSGL